MEGNAFMGEYDTTKRDYVYGSSDRFDEFTDRIRSVRNKNYLYLRNSFPELPKYKDVGYRKNIPMMASFLQLRDENKLNDVQQIWFGTKTSEELYDVIKDPYQINNLSENPEYASVLSEMRIALNDFQKDKTDFGSIPEAELINQMWPDFQQPITEAVTLRTSTALSTGSVETSKGKEVSLSTKTKGASIAYIISDNPNENFDFNSGWQLYVNPFLVEKGKYIYTMAQRIGFKESAINQKEIQ